MKKTIIISGRVQGVGYRFWAKRTAERLGLECSAENLPDGKVELVLVGNKEKIDEMVQKCHKGPFLAQVEKVEIK